MVASPAVTAVVADVLWCLGLGCLLGSCRDLVGLVLGEGPLRRFCWDVMAFVAAAVLLCGFSAGVSDSGLARWYMAVALLIGVVCWHCTVQPAVHRALYGLCRLMLWPIHWLQRHLVQPCRNRLMAGGRRLRGRFARKKGGKKPKNGKKQLQKPSKIVYN